MGKTYIGRKGARDLERDAKPGMKIYYINDHANMPGQFEAQTYSTLFCTRRGGLLKVGWLFAHGSEHRGQIYGKGNITVESAVLGLGGVSTTPPPGLRELASPERDCRDEGYGPPRSWATETRRLDRDELDHMGKRSREAGDQRADDIKAGRRKWF